MAKQKREKLHQIRQKNRLKKLKRDKRKKLKAAKKPREERILTEHDVVDVVKRAKVTEVVTEQFDKGAFSMSAPASNMRDRKMEDTVLNSEEFDSSAWKIDDNG